MVSSEGLRIAIVKGSVRPENFTARAVALVVDEIEGRGNIEVDVIDPASLNLPPPGVSDADSDAQALQERVGRATGVILATPEYHGSFSSVMKLAIENMGFPSALSGKPVALLGVAAGLIGAIKSLEHLRSVASHVGGIVLPGPVSVANVNRYFDAGGNITDEKMDRTIRRVAVSLIDYMSANLCTAKCLEEMVRGEVA